MASHFETSDSQGRSSFICMMCHGTGHVAAEPKGPPRRSGFPQYMVRRIVALVEGCLEGRTRTAELSGRIGYSPSHFSRLFRRSFGVSPHTYILRRRVALAQRLLTQTDLALAEIALKAGFSDQSHLSRTVRRFSGMPPRQFRAESRTELDDEVAAALGLKEAAAIALVPEGPSRGVTRLTAGEARLS
jgi:transcriptional regulator GlxA family with amidase domain